MLGFVRKYAAIGLTVTAVITVAAYAMSIPLPFKPSKTCIYEGIEARCSELIITTSTYGNHFEKARENITQQVTHLGGMVLTSDAVLNRIIVRFESADDLTSIKRQLEAVPEINSVAYSAESVLDSFGH